MKDIPQNYVCCTCKENQAVVFYYNMPFCSEECYDGHSPVCSDPSAPCNKENHKEEYNKIQEWFDVFTCKGYNYDILKMFQKGSKTHYYYTFRFSLRWHFEEAQEYINKDGFFKLFKSLYLQGQTILGMDENDPDFHKKVLNIYQDTWEKTGKFVEREKNNLGLYTFGNALIFTGTSSL